MGGVSDNVIIPQEFEPECAIDSLSEHPDNPRDGDEEAIEASIDAHGFYGAVMAQKSTRFIVAGNHRHRELKRRGSAVIPVMWLDVDDDEAVRILLNDNQSNDNAGYRDEILLGLLERMQATDVGLIGTGYGDGDLAKLLEQMKPEPIEDPAPLDEGAEHVCPYCAARWKSTSRGVVRLDQ